MAKKPLDKDAANRTLVTQGWFHGLNTLIRDHELNANEVAKIKPQLFRLILAKVQEAKTEVDRLQTVVRRLEATCRQGMIPRPSEGANAYGPTVSQLREEVKALDGWTISLLESSISILMAAENPATGGKRVNDLKESFANLWSLRLEGWRSMKRFPEQFDVTTIVLDK